MKQIKRAALLIVVLAFMQPVLHGSMGIKMGFQRAEYEEINEFNLNSYKIGVFYSFRLGKNVLLQPELYFSQFGSRVYGSDWMTGKLNKETLSYIELPLLVKYRVPLGSRLRPVFFGGGYFAYRVSKNLFDIITEIYGECYVPPSPYITYIPYSETDSGVVVGIGLEHIGSTTSMHFDLRVNIGLLNVYNGTPDFKKRNHSLSFMVGVGF